MREITFRAWVDATKKMYGLDLESQFRDGRESFREAPFASDWNYEDCPIMQFTGLKDKNDTDIFEGDILQLHCGSQDGTFERAKVKGEVVWNKDRFTVKIPNKKVKVKGGSMNGKMVSVLEMHTWVGAHTCLLEWQSKLEVIGNIYENPELLESNSH